VYDTGAEERVYNLRVAEYHTYFVGCDEWGFSVWAHNADCSPQQVSAAVQEVLGKGKHFESHPGLAKQVSDALNLGTESGRAQAVRLLKNNLDGVGPAKAEMNVSDLVKNRMKVAIIEDGLPGHLQFQDHTVPRSSGIGGAHSVDAFDPAVTAMGARVNSRTQHHTLPGVERVDYSIPALDHTGRPTGGCKATPFRKTVYDPTQVSHADFLALGREAANDAVARGALTREWTGTASNGVVYRGYLNDRGAVRSFFPDF